MNNIRVLTNESNRICIAYGRDMIWVSYTSCIAYIEESRLTRLGKDYAYSRTTSKHMNQFIDEWSGVYLEVEDIPQLRKYATQENRIYLGRLSRADRRIVLDTYYEHQEQPGKE